MKYCLLALLLIVAGKSSASLVSLDSLAPETKDSMIVLRDVASAAELDSAIYCYYEDLIQLSHEVYSLDELVMPDTLPAFTAEDYQKRLAQLDVATPFDLSYNSIVEAFIHLYVSRKRELSAKCLGRSDMYFPMFEEALDKHGLPLELKYLAVVESALDPKARSRAGATGIWQFMYGTGKLFGLEINSYVDERCDPVQSTEAACKYFKHLYNMFGDWNLALAAYNCGEGRVTKAIRRSGGKKNYWDIYPYLPRETRGYVPAFIAVNYLFAHASDHLITPMPAAYHAFEVDSVHVNTRLTFSQIATLLDMDVESIALLNPVYRLNEIPAYGEYRALNLPKDKINLWVANEDAIYEKLATLEPKKPSTAPASVSQAPKDVIYYTVRTGDYLGRIAARHGCTVRQIQQWNGISGSSIRPGQKLVLYADHVKAPAPTATAKPVQTHTQGANLYYSIQPGDTLWDIAKSRGVSVDDLKRWNSHLNFNNIKPGQKIVVGKTS